MPAYNYYGGNYGNQYGAWAYPQNGFQNQPVMQQPMQVQQVQPAQVSGSNQPVQQIQNGGFVTVRSEADAKAYPVAPGMSVTFKHETQPYCYTKTMGFSQFEAPRFEKFRLVKEDDDTQGEAKEQDASTYVSQEDFGKVVNVVQGLNELVGNMKTDLENVKGDLYGIAGKKKTARKSEVVEDDA